MKKTLACLFAFLLLLFHPPFLFAPNARGEAEENKCIYLTFDDGPSDRITPKILDVLKEHGVHATFFVVGKNVQLREELTKRIVEEGNSVGVHSYSHEYKTIYSSPKALMRDIERCNEVLRRLSIHTRLYRFPGGEDMAGEAFHEEVKKKGYESIGWNALCCDAELYRPTPEELYQKAIASGKEKQKIVMLMHDATDKKQTLFMLPRLIEHYQALGYAFCTFDMA